jgi:hypothetical protein
VFALATDCISFKKTDRLYTLLYVCMYVGLTWMFPDSMLWKNEKRMQNVSQNPKSMLNHSE